MLAVKGTRTVENTLLPFDRASEHLTLDGNQTGIMFEVHPDKAIRDKAQALVQVISAEGASLALNQDVYHALVAVDVSKADAATKHYMERTLLEYRLGGVDKDQATRDKVKQLQDRMTEVSLKFSRNVQDDVRKIPVKNVGELDGLPADYIARHKPAADGTITLTTNSPDMSPVMSYAKSARAAKGDVPGVQQPGVSGEHCGAERPFAGAAGDGDDTGLQDVGRSCDGRPDDGVCR